MKPSFVKKEYKPFNTKKTPMRFETEQQALDFADANRIEPEQEFWFVVEKYGVLFECIFELTYEG